MRKTVSKSCLVLALTGAMATAFGCMGNSGTTGATLDDSLEELPSYGYVEENTVRLCSDGLDNDGDTLIDCDDPGCSLTGNTYDPGNIVSKKNENGVLDESTDFMCSDGKDNDGDGFVDCRDRSCYKTLSCCPSQIKDQNYESTMELCSDGVDNDCDGYSDCSDKSCYQSSDPEVLKHCAEKICKDKCMSAYPDNCLTDPTCLLEVCSDGVDNDMNGYVDCKDKTCAELEYCTGEVLGGLVENTEALCSDNIDNDLDGRADCDDPDCLDLQIDYCEDLTPEPGARASNFNSMTEEEKLEVYKKEHELCTDNKDNDHNGKTDCEEYRCQVLSLTDLSPLEKKYNVKLNIDCGL